MQKLIEEENKSRLDVKSLEKIIRNSISEELENLRLGYS
jgi:hypothetical protein